MTRSTITCEGNKVTVTTGHLKTVFIKREWSTAAEMMAMIQESLVDEHVTVARLVKERDEAREAARWLGELRPLGAQDADDKRTILERWPWLVEENK